jgi:hypothetical protein
MCGDRDVLAQSIEAVNALRRNRYVDVRGKREAEVRLIVIRPHNSFEMSGRGTNPLLFFKHPNQTTCSAIRPASPVRSIERLGRLM